MWTLILFTRWPEPGRTKTRLIPAFGAEGAARIHRQMIARTVCAGRSLHSGARVAVALADAPAFALTHELFDVTWPVFAQHGSDLGERMSNAIDFVFEESPSCDRVVLVGVDCPDYSPTLFLDAAERLQHNDVVFAPTEDGGYGLIGVSRGRWTGDTKNALFSGIPWGGADVMTVTESRLSELDDRHRESVIKVAMVATIWDIDTAADVKRAIALGVLRENEISGGA
jgi:uncharacterized protein